ncbi:MAG TPA: S9 family peptidase [Kofleriaceae bacterium]|nr:S9 family peptidase [Kofleriaceae bacterium]
MKRLVLVAALITGPAVAGCGSSSSQTASTAGTPGAADRAGGPRPPVAARHHHVVTSPNGDREDPYYWLRDDTRKNPDMIAYLNAENAYAAAVLGPAKSLEDTLFAEMKSRIKDDDTSLPVLDDGYWYYARFSAGQEHPVVVRKKGTLDAPEEVVLDGNELARGHEFFSLGGRAVSRDGHLIAWTDDTVGRRQFALHIKDLRTGKMLPDTATNVARDVEWANDNKTVFYVGKDPTTLREDRVFRHVLGEPGDAQVFLEPDGQYYVGIGRTKSRRFIQITLHATTHDEVRLIDAERPSAPDRVVLPREVGHLYSIDHLDGRFVIRTNAGAKNFRLVEVPEAKVADRSAWRDLIPASSDALVEDFTVARKFVAATVRVGGLARVRVLPASGAPFYVEPSEPAFVMGVVDTPDPNAARVRYDYTSPVAPRSVIEVDLATHARTTLKVEPVPGYDPAGYAAEYLHATASDGTKVPVSVVYKKDTKRDGTAPLLVTGYGSYGISSEPAFSSRSVSLLDRGWVVATAHVRGGQEMGRAWYEDGKLNHKRNTFTDFIAATEYLVASKLGARDQVYALGGSAGGLLMGAILNLRPDLYRGVVALVPFVDVMTTMLDESIPLTTNEFDEWGNPKDKAAYDYMLSYSPYDNVKPTAYPSIYVKTGLWDSQVQYFEPAKWVARLRATKTDDNLIVLDTDMAAGHGGKSGRFDRLHDAARYTAFMLLVHDRPDRRTR